MVDWLKRAGANVIGALALVLVAAVLMGAWYAWGELTGNTVVSPIGKDPACVYVNANPAVSCERRPQKWDPNCIIVTHDEAHPYLPCPR